jgi:hypothetical protein
VVGVGWLVARRAGPALLLLGASLVGSWYVTRRGSPWSDAKALMIVSPAIALACVCGPAGLWNARRRGEAMLLAAAIAAGVIWTNAVAYHDADLAPRDRLTELASIARGMAGPTLYPEFEEFAKHFLRRGDPTGPAEGRPGRLVPRTGRVPFGFPTDIGALDLPYVERFATLVLRRSPVASRPPANYRLVRTGRWYEVWRRGSSRVLGHVALGDALQPGATTSCAQVRRVARRAERLGASLATVVRGRALVSVFSRGRLPAGWAPDGVDPLAVRPVGQGRVDVGVTVARRDRYAVWIQGSFGRGVSAAIDGRRIGAVRNELSGRRQYASVGSAELGRGAHEITLMRGGGGLYPGDGGHNRLIGPLVLAPTRDQVRHVQVVPTARWRSLCGQRLDWLEIVAP